MFCRLMLKDSSSLRLLPTSALEDYFSQIFFHNPWYDESIPSLVYKRTDGRIIGFIGVVPRRMTYHGKAIRVAVSFHFMVDPDSRSSLAGVQILKHFFSGPQDLSITDGAGEIGRKIWEGVGGTTAWAYSLFWTKILRPGQYAAGLIGNRKYFKPFAWAATPFCKIADASTAILAPNIYAPQVDISKEEELDLDVLINHAHHFAQKRSLLPVYEAESLRWLFDQLDQMNYYGALKKILVRDDNGEIIGWFIYYLKPGGTSTVIQFLSNKNSIQTTIDHLFHHARRHNSIALHGRLDPRLMQEFSDNRGYFNRNGSWLLVHSRDLNILHSIQSSEALLTGLEGEFGLLF
ncbi:MAG: hypothetical protein IPM55_03120 [Acidobacteria bacterium]|nr:hypothetical protein [Acidobacteriota bacterium]